MVIAQGIVEQRLLLKCFKNTGTIHVAQKLDIQVELKARCKDSQAGPLS
jgi:hypothetical protein